MLPLKIISTGKALPARLVRDTDIDAELGLVPGSSYKKGGVKTRYFAAESESQSGLAAAALNDALSRARLLPDSLDLLIAACGVQEQALPSTACAIAAHLDLPPGRPAFDVNASCLSFMAALNVAAGLLQAGAYQRIGIVSSDLASRGIDWNEPEASLIFGDGAAAAIVERGDGTAGVEAFSLGTYPEGRAFCEIRAGGTRRNPRIGAEPKDFLFRMDGKAVFKLASQKMQFHLDALMREAKTSLDAMDVVVPHQASHLGMAHVAKKLGLTADRVVDIYASHGNQVAASLPTALHEAYLTGRAGNGKRVLLLGTAAGLTIGGMVLRT